LPFENERFSLGNEMRRIERRKFFPAPTAEKTAVDAGNNSPFIYTGKKRHRGWTRFPAHAIVQSRCGDRRKSSGPRDGVFPSQNCKNLVLN
jgi:hypothetical protein